MSTIADQLAEALWNLIGWIPNAATLERMGFHTDAPVKAHALAKEALAAYEASRHAPAVREVNSDDVDAAWDAYFDVTPKDGDFINSSGIGAALNSFRDRLNGEGG